MGAKGAGLIGNYRGFRRDARLLVYAGLIINLGYALNGFVLVLYLNVLGHPSVLFGLLALLMELGTVAVLLGSGVMADLWGRKKVLLLASVIGTVGIGFFVFFETVPYFILASLLIGISGGLWGPPYNALMSEKCSAKRRSYLFSLNSIISQLGSGVITLIGGFIPLVFISYFSFGSEAAYRMVFVLWLLINVACIFIVSRLRPERKRVRAYADPTEERVRPWGLILKFSVPSAITGLGAGLLVPYFPLYFKLRFEIDIGAIGIIFALLSFSMAIITIYLPRMAERGGTVLTSVLFHTCAIFAMISIPFAPWLSIVVILFVFRAAMMNVPNPIMTSFMMSKLPRGLRATAQSSTAFAWMVNHAAGVFIGGFLWDMDETLRIPFYISTVLYVIATVLYLAFFYRMDDKKHGPSVLPRLLPQRG